MSPGKAKAAVKGPRVMVLVGSRSDLPLTEPMAPLFARFGLTYAVQVVSAHRQPDTLRKTVARAEKEGAEVFVAMAGLAAHLPGVVASLTGLPVIGVPLAAGPLAGVDALLSVVQMPPGVPVAAVAVGGVQNAVCLAARILALGDRQVAAAVAEYRLELARGGR